MPVFGWSKVLWDGVVLTRGTFSNPPLNYKCLHFTKWKGRLGGSGGEFWWWWWWFSFLLWWSSWWWHWRDFSSKNCLCFNFSNFWKTCIIDKFQGQDQVLDSKEAEYRSFGSEGSQTPGERFWIFGRCGSPLRRSHGRWPECRSHEGRTQAGPKAKSVNPEGPQTLVWIYIVKQGWLWVSAFTAFPTTN